MKRGSRFLMDHRCGKKDGKLFKDVMKGVCRLVRQTKDFAFFIRWRTSLWADLV